MGGEEFARGTVKLRDLNTRQETELPVGEGSHAMLSAICEAVVAPGPGGWTAEKCEYLRTKLCDLIGGDVDREEAREVAANAVSGALAMLSSVPSGCLDSEHLPEVLHMMHSVLEDPYVMV